MKDNGVSSDHAQQDNQHTYPSGMDFCLYVPPPEPVSLDEDRLLGELRHWDLAKAMDETVT